MADPRLSDHVNLKEALRSFSQESRAVMLDDADVSRLFGRALERVIELEAEVAQSSLNEKEYLERIAELDRENFALRMETMSDLVERLEGGARNMGVNRATLREAAQAIKGWETFAAVKQQRIEELERERKRDCVAFFHWFWNQPGTNAEQGYDEWVRSTQQSSGAQHE